MAKVLFIEDKPDWQERLQDLLDTAGYEAYRATSFDSAINAISSKKDFEVIVFDLLLGEKFPSTNRFVWLDALVQGLAARKLKVPPIIIVTGIEVTKKEIIQAFTEYHTFVFGCFEKKDFDPKDFLDRVKQAVECNSDYHPKPKSFFRLFAYALLMTAIVISTFLVLLWSVQSIQDAQTQQTILKVGGTIIVVVAIFIAVFNQNAKIESVIESITKIWRG